MFDSLDENSPARMPSATERRRSPAFRIWYPIWLALYPLMRLYGKPEQLRPILLGALAIGGVVIFGLFEYRAWRERRDGPMGLEL